MEAIDLTRREFLKTVAATLAAMGVKTSPINRDKPNIIFVLVDQMRFSAMGCMKGIPGAECEARSIETPNLDKLASKGVLFSNAFSNTPVCAPARTGIQTGKYAHVTTDKLRPGETTLPMCFKKAGYQTGYIGKWHMSPPESKLRKKEESLPSSYVYPVDRVGWDFFAGHEAGHNYFGKGALYYLNENKNPIRLKDGAYEPEIQADMAIEYIKKNKENPFLLFLSWGPPHWPYKPPAAYDVLDPRKIILKPNVHNRFQTAARKDLVKYYAQIISLDTQVGRIMGALDKQGLEENTILWFTSDHGDMHYSHEDYENGLMPGKKRRPWDEAARIPSIISWPKRIKPNQRTDTLFPLVNTMPTLLGLAGLPASGTAQGKDLSSLVLGNKSEEEDAVFMEQLHPGKTINLSPWRAVRTKRYLYAQSGHEENPDWLLYDVTQDPYQLKNLIQDPKMEKIKTQLQEKLVSWRKETGDTQNLRTKYLEFKKERQKKLEGH